MKTSCLKEKSLAQKNGYCTLLLSVEGKSLSQRNSFSRVMRDQNEVFAYLLDDSFYFIIIDVCHVKG